MAHLISRVLRNPWLARLASISKGVLSWTASPRPVWPSSMPATLRSALSRWVPRVLRTLLASRTLPLPLSLPKRIPRSRLPSRWLRSSSALSWRGGSSASLSAPKPDAGARGVVPLCGTPLARRVGALVSALSVLFFSLVYPARSYAAVPLLVPLAGVAVRSAAGSVLLPLASAAGRVVPLANGLRNLQGVSPGVAIAATGLGLWSMNQEWARVTPAKSGPSQPLETAQTTPTVETKSPDTHEYQAYGYPGKGPFSSSPEIAVRDFGNSCLFQNWWFGNCSRSVVSQSCPLNSGNCDVTFSGGSTAPIAYTSRLTCGSGWAVDGSSCRRLSCPSGYSLVGDLCVSFQATYPADGIPTFQATEGGGWRADPRDPDAPSPDVLSSLTNGFSTVDQYGNPVTGQLRSLQDGGLALDVNVVGQSSAGNPTITKNTITMDPSGNIVSYSSITNYYNSTTNTEGAVADIPTDYARDKTLSEVQAILDKWVKADQAAKDQATQAIDQTRAQVDSTLKTMPKYSVDELGLPKQDQFEKWDLEGWKTAIPASEGGCVTYTMGSAVAGRGMVIDPCPWLPHYKPYLNYSVIALAALAALFYVLGRRPDELSR